MQGCSLAAYHPSQQIHVGAVRRWYTLSDVQVNVEDYYTFGANTYIQENIYLAIVQSYAGFCLNYAMYSGYNADNWGNPFAIQKHYFYWPSGPPISMWRSPRVATYGYTHMFATGETAYQGWGNDCIYLAMSPGQSSFRYSHWSSFALASHTRSIYQYVTGENAMEWRWISCDTSQAAIFVTPCEQLRKLQGCPYLHA